MKKLLISSMAILTALSVMGCSEGYERDDVEITVSTKGEVVKLISWNGYKLKDFDKIKDDNGNIKVILEFDKKSK